MIYNNSTSAKYIVKTREVDHGGMFKKIEHLVLNTESGAIQSSWSKKWDAVGVSRDLNKHDAAEKKAAVIIPEVVDYVYPKRGQRAG